MEMAAYRSYKGYDFRINFWRTKSGLEVDYIIGDGETAIEVKSTDNVDVRNLKGLYAFMDTYSPRRSIVVCNEKEKRIHGRIEIIPWREFLYELWDGKILK